MNMPIKETWSYAQIIQYRNINENVKAQLPHVRIQPSTKYIQVWYYTNMSQTYLQQFGWYMIWWLWGWCTNLVCPIWESNPVTNMYKFDNTPLSDRHELSVEDFMCEYVKTSDACMHGTMYVHHCYLGNHHFLSVSSRQWSWPSLLDSSCSENVQNVF